MIEMSAMPRQFYQFGRGSGTRLALCVLASTALTPITHAQEAAVAPQPAAADELVPEEITVVGTRIDTSDPMKVPMAVTRASAETLQDLRISSVKDLVAIEPTFRVTRSYQGTPQYSIRGIGFNAINMSASPTVGLYQDDVAYPYPFTQLGPIFDLSGAEILKGPQGTIFGRNTTAGVVKLDSNQPTNTFQGSFAVDIGNYQTLNYEGFLSGPITSWLNGRIAFRTENSFEGWQRSRTRPDERLGEIHNHGFRLILDADPAPGLDIKLTVNGWHNDSDTRAVQAIALTPGVDNILLPESTAAGATNPDLIAFLGYVKGGTGPSLAWANSRHADWASAEPMPAVLDNITRVNPTTDTSVSLKDNQPGRAMNVGSSIGMPGQLQENTSFWSANLDIGYDITDNLRIVSLTSYQKLNRNSLQDVSGAPFEILVQNPKGKIESISQELRLSANLGRLKLSAGGYYGRDDIQENIRSLINNNSNSEAIRNVYPTTFYSIGDLLLTGANNRQYLIYGRSRSVRNAPNTTGLEFGTSEGMFRTLRDTGDYHITTKSLLANAELKVTDWMTLSAGGRYTWDRLHFEGCTRDVNGNTIQGVDSVIAVLIASKTANGGAASVPVNLARPGECITMSRPVNATGQPTGPYVRGLVVNDLNEENFSWRGALTLRPLDELMIYASASRGYKSGVNPLNTANLDLQDSPVKQEELTAYEAGMRVDLKGVKIGGGGFYYDYKNKQLSGYFADPVFTTLARLVNVPRSRAYGFEGDARIEPFRGFALFGNALYLKTKILEDIRLNEIGFNADYRGSTFGNPTWALSGGGSFDTPINENFLLRGILSYRWQSETSLPKSTQLPYTVLVRGQPVVRPAIPSPGQDRYDLPAYGVLDGSLTLVKGNRKGWELSLWGRNILQRSYYTSVNSNATTIFRIPGDPRTYGATFRVNF